MAQYRATIDGRKGEVSRLGNKKSGLVAWVNGWRSGVSVVARFNEAKQEDEFVVYATGGSSGSHEAQFIGTVTDKGRFIPAGDGESAR